LSTDDVLFDADSLTVVSCEEASIGTVTGRGFMVGTPIVN